MSRTLGMLVLGASLLAMACGDGRRSSRWDGSPGDGGGAGDGGGCLTAADCDDGVACTDDLCTSGYCASRPVHARCAAGESCDREDGCVGGTPCGSAADCEDDDPCTTAERCDPTSRTCRFDELDGDGDGDPPRVCGGTDCDDSDWSVYGGAEEQCDGVDNDCDGVVDGARAEETCPGDRTCGPTGYCQCPDPLEDCGGESCTDVSSDLEHCGTCFNRCPSAASCSGGTCACPSGLTACVSSCVDTASDEDHCGACGRRCGTGQTCVGGTCQCAGGLTACGSSCVDTATDELNCGTCGRSCASAQTCLSGVCRCPTGQTLCGSSCVSTSTNPSHCGGCFSPCAGGEVCSGGVCAGLCYEGDACTSSTSCGTGGTCIPQTTTTYTPVTGLPGGGTSVSITSWSAGYCSVGLGTIDAAGTCTPGEVGAAAGCNDCAECVDLDGTTAGCFEQCTRSNTIRGGCRTGYACDFTFGVCFPDCGSTTACRIRREDTNGDGAVTTADSYVYDPASTATCSSVTGRCTHSGATGAVAGNTCTRSSQCEADGICALAEMGWPGGYCTKQACELPGRACAGTGSICHPRAFGGDASYCLKGCTVGAEPASDQLGTTGHGAGCRTGYQCLWNGTGSTGTNGGCVPGNYNAVTTNNVGQACGSDADCYSPYGAGICVAAWPGGACTILDCAAPGMPAGVCGTGNQCVTEPGVSFCLPECTVSTDCRTGYTCVDHDASTTTPRVCSPT